MITDFNEDEISRFQAKLEMLMKCKKIQRLGYEYERDQYIYIDPIIEDGYEPIDHVAFINTVLAPVIDYGFCEYTENIDTEILKKLPICIPYSEYDDESIVGFTIKLMNKFIDEYLNKNLGKEKLEQLGKKNIDSNCYCCESIIDCIQVTVNEEEKALYIVIPDSFVDIDLFIDSIIEFLEAMHKEIEKANKITKEAA